MSQSAGPLVLQLQKLTELFNLLTGRGVYFNTLIEARNELGKLTQNSRLLVVLDDVWEPDDPDNFNSLGPNCRLLITTRNWRVLDRARADRQEIGLLDSDAARTFLAQAANTEVDSLPIEADGLIEKCGGLPLALAAAGGLIRRGTYTWGEVLSALKEAALREFDTSWLPDPEYRSLGALLRVSVDALPKDIRSCFLDCAALPQKLTIPEGALIRLWSVPGEPERRCKLILSELVDRSLIHREGDKTYSIHDIYYDYLRHAAAPITNRHKRLLNQYRLTCSSGWSTCPDDGYCIQWIPWHLREANELYELRKLLFDLPWMKAKLSATGPGSLIRGLQTSSW